jgi:hypothetical protein
VGIILLGSDLCLIGGSDDKPEEISITTTATFDALCVLFGLKGGYQSHYCPCELVLGLADYYWVSQSRANSVCASCSVPHNCVVKSSLDSTQFGDAGDP